MSEYITERELAELLGLGLSTIQQMRYAGRGPHYLKVGRRIRYAREDVDRWRQANTIKTDESR